MNVWYDIVEKSRNKQKVKIFVSLCFIIPFSTIPFAPDCQGVCNYSIFMGSAMFIWVIAMFYMNFFYSTFKILGIIQFENNKIIILENEFSVETIKHIKILINSYEGDSTNRRPSEGCDNEISIVLKNGTLLNYKFKIPSLKHINIISKVLKDYKNMGIFVSLVNNR